ncbi:MAG: hypothetical protein EAX95_05980 [Candidatus Thorarchaeota archaeon]|nr:hypothetical protein [Candidatus Thorarchaeota archaeon]
MSSIEDRSLDQLADMILNVLWQDLLEVFTAIRAKMEAEGEDKVKAAFQGAVNRFLGGPFSEHVEVRWGMNLCVHCNDDNIEKNGIAYVKTSGDGIEFNQCLNCRIGILYSLATAKATLDTYTIGLGKPGQFNGMSFFWNAIVPNGLAKFLPSYEIVHGGQWIGTVSIDDTFKPRYLPFDSMKDSIPRDANEPWSDDLPLDLVQAVNQFIEAARPHIEVALALR